MDQIDDQFFLKETFRFAKKGMGWTNPNPMVGAIIVKNGHIIAKGYHKRFGGPHAEIVAINSAKSNLKGATLYVSLEPCCYFGKTQPCTDAIIKTGITKVVCPVLDPNPKVAGKGVQALKHAGVTVLVGILKNQSGLLNEAFFTFHQKERPFIAIKFAASLDGKIATKTGDSQWITNEKARLYARKLRGEYQAVLVGINTVLKDDPHLGTRMKGKKDPLRIILDSHLKIPLNSQALRDNNILIVTTSKHNKQKLAKLVQKDFQVLTVSGEQISIPELLLKLKEKEIISLLIEGGGKTIGSFVDAELVDKVYAFFSPILIGGEHALTAVRGKGVSKINQGIILNRTSFKRFEDNYLIAGYPQQK